MPTEAPGPPVGVASSERKKRVVVTGAAGKLGRVTVPVLRAEGYEVVATDRVPAPELGPDLVRLDLRSNGGLVDLLKGAGAIVHLAALPARGPTPAADAFAETIEIMASILAASLDAGISTFVYASSIQVIALEGAAEVGPARVAYLPLDDESPPNPTTAYGFSKLGCESLLQTLFGQPGRQAIALRFPWLVPSDPHQPWGRRLSPLDRTEARSSVEQGFSCLSLHDAARLVHAVLRADLPGFRRYLPAVSVVPREYIPHYVKRYYHEVPLRVPIEHLGSLIDLSRIERDTGWVPLELPISGPPSPTGVTSLGRLARRLWGTR